MKKILIVLLCLLTLVGCSSKQGQANIINSGEQQTGGEATGGEIIAGNWQETEKIADISDEVLEIYYKAIAEKTDATYHPLALLATQVVAGTNYKILAEKIQENPENYELVELIIYNDLQGNATINSCEPYIMTEERTGTSAVVNDKNRVAYTTFEKWSESLSVDVFAYEYNNEKMISSNKRYYLKDTSTINSIYDRLMQGEGLPGKYTIVNNCINSDISESVINELGNWTKQDLYNTLASRQ